MRIREVSQGTCADASELTLLHRTVFRSDSDISSYHPRYGYYRERQANPGSRDICCTKQIDELIEGHEYTRGVAQKHILEMHKLINAPEIRAYIGYDVRDEPVAFAVWSMPKAIVPHTWLQKLNNFLKSRWVPSCQLWLKLIHSNYFTTHEQDDAAAFERNRKNSEHFGCDMNIPQIYATELLLFGVVRQGRRLGTVFFGRVLAQIEDELKTIPLPKECPYRMQMIILASRAGQRLYSNFGFTLCQDWTPPVENQHDPTVLMIRRESSPRS